MEGEHLIDCISKLKILDTTIIIKKCEIQTYIHPNIKTYTHTYMHTYIYTGPPFMEGEHLIDNSSKLKILDALLTKAKKEGSRVLVFSQMTRMLDIIEVLRFLHAYVYEMLLWNWRICAS